MTDTRSRHSIKMLTVANMYPSESYPAYGTFVKNFVDRFDALNTGGSNKVVTIKGKRKGMVSKLLTYAAYYCRLTYELTAHRYDLVYVHTVTFPTPALRIASLFRRLPLVFNVHGDDVLPGNRFKKALKRLSRPLVRKARMIVSPSDYFSDVVSREFPGLSPERIFVSPSGGLDKRFFVAQPEPKNSGVPVIGFVSRIDKGKGWETLLAALARLRDNGHRFKAVIAGSGAQEPQMKEMIAQLGLDSLTDCIGAVGHDRLPQVYRSFDLFIFPTQRANESLGLVGLEAMAAGVPVIAGNIGGPAGYVRNGGNGYLFPPGDADALTERIEQFLSLPPEKRLEMGREALDTARGYEAGKVARNLYDRLQEIITYAS